MEVEGRWNILPRWALLGFVGIGAVGGSDPIFETQDNIIACGIGSRYLFMQD
ncbi:MAG: hypothetical protein HKP58_01700 [Desulfatitalea sp.]|nr:hypothetical protein [Desulfatitalea sp.]NNJ99101.1 hypothetical protein [Desulfatitalea sp.]